MGAQQAQTAPERPSFGMRVSNAPKNHPSLQIPKMEGTEKREFTRATGAVPIVARRLMSGAVQGKVGSIPAVEKVKLTRAEIASWVDTLWRMIQSIERAVAEKSDLKCVHDVISGPYLLIMKIYVYLREMDKKGAESFEITRVELSAMQQAVECANEIEKSRTTRSWVGLGVVGAMFGVALLI